MLGIPAVISAVTPAKQGWLHRQPPLPAAGKGPGLWAAVPWGPSLSQINAAAASLKELNLTERISIKFMPWRTRGFSRDFNSAHKQL